MSEEKKFLSLLQVAVPPDTALTVAAQVKILEILGIVSSPELVKSAEIAVGMIPNNTPASLHGLLVMLNNIVRNHPKADKSHQDELDVVMKDVGKLQDTPLNFGLFLPICEAIMKAIEKEAGLHKKKTAAKTATRKPPAKKAAKK
jgi:hypothetical protein